MDNVTLVRANGIKINGVNINLNNILTKTDANANSLSVSGTSNLQGSITGSATLNVLGSTSLNGSVTVSGATSLNSSVTVSGVTNLNSSVTVSGATKLNSSVTVSGATSLNSSVTVSGATSLNSSVTVSGATSLNSSVTVSGATKLNSSVTINGATTLLTNLSVVGNITNLGALSVGGTANLNNGLVVSGASTLLNSLNVSGNTIICGNLIVSGTSNLGGASTMFSSINVTGNANINQLYVSGTVALNNGLTVSGGTTLLTNLNVLGSLAVSGTAALNNGLTVSGGTTLLTNLNVLGSLAVSGTAALNNGLTVSGATTLLSNLNVVGSTTKLGSLAVSGTTALNNGLTVSGGTTFLSNLYISGNTYILGNLILTGTSNIVGGGGAAFNGTVTTNLYVSGTTTLVSSLTVSGFSNLSNSIFSASGNTFINGNLLLNNKYINSPSGINYVSSTYTFSTTVPANITTPSTLNLSTVVWSYELDKFCAITSDGTQSAISSDGINWTQHSISPSTFVDSGNWNIIVWAAKLGKFFVYNYNSNTAPQSNYGVVLSSTNGTSWTVNNGYYTTPTDYVTSFLSACWSNELGLMCGSSYETNIMRSTNGIQWTLSYNAPSIVRGMCWAPHYFNPTTKAIGLFCAVTDNGSILTSPDGTNWTNQGKKGTDGNWFGIAWSPLYNTFVTVRNNSNTILIGTVDTNTGIITWQEFTTLPSTNSWKSITWSPELKAFCIVATAVGNGNPILVSSYSNDTWSWIPYASATALRSVAWSPTASTFCAVGNNANIATTQITTGITTKVKMNNTLIVSGATTLASNLFVSGSLNISGATTISSTLFVSGATTISSNLFVSGATIISGGLIVSGPSNLGFNGTVTTNLFVSGNTIIKNNLQISGFTNLVPGNDNYPTTNDELIVKTWTENSSASIRYGWKTVCYAPELGIFCALTGNSTSVGYAMVSNDGLNWQTITSSNLVNNWQCIAWSPKLRMFCGGAYNGTSCQRFIYSYDGVTWNAPNTDINGNNWSAYSMCWSYDLELFCIGDSSGKLITSPDGLNWTYVSTVPNGGTIRAICWAGNCVDPNRPGSVGVLCAITDSSICISSDVGLTWNNVSNIYSYVYGVTWSPSLKLFCLAADTASGSPKMVTSPDGKTWTAASSGVDNTMSYWAICWAPEAKLFCAVARPGWNSGSSGPYKIITSSNGRSWTSRFTTTSALSSVCWGSNLGTFCAVSDGGSGPQVITSNMAGRIPTNLTVFGSPYNNIDNTGSWTVKTKKLYHDQSITFGTTTNTMLSLNTMNGSTTLASNLFVSSSLNVSGATTISSNLYISGANLTTYDLALANDKAAKPGTNTWTISSDQRLKENIVVADYDECYQSMSGLDLKYYKWRDNIDGIGPSNIPDRHKLGWIAQDVETVFPKAVDTVPEMYGLTDVKTLNSDQIYACMYGTIKKLMAEVETLKSQVNTLLNN